MSNVQVRLISKHADIKALENSTIKLYEGEIVLAKVNISNMNGESSSAFIAKVGVEGKTFSESPWLFTKSSDVYL